MKFAHFRMFAAALVAMTLLPLASARGQGKIVSEGVEAASKQIFRRAGSEGAEQLMKFGGREAVERVLIVAQREGGETLVARITRLTADHGPGVLRAVEPAPARMAGAIDNLAPALRGPAIRAAEREPTLMARLVGAHGDEALEVAARHPGVGEQLVTTLGREGIESGARLSTPQATLLARHADDIAQLPAADRSAFFAMLRRAPDRVLGALERHPQVLKRGAQVVIAGQVVTGGVIGMYALRDELFGRPDAQGRGFVERLTNDTFQTFHRPLSLGLLLLAAAIATWALAHGWGVTRIARARAAAIAAAKSGMATSLARRGR